MGVVCAVVKSCHSIIELSVVVSFIYAVRKRVLHPLNPLREMVDARGNDSEMNMTGLAPLRSSIVWPKVGSKLAVGNSDPLTFSEIVMWLEPSGQPVPEYLVSRKCAPVPRVVSWAITSKGSRRENESFILLAFAYVCWTTRRLWLSTGSRYGKCVGLISFVEEALNLVHATFSAKSIAVHREVILWRTRYRKDGWRINS